MTPEKRLLAALGFTFCEAHAQIDTVPGMPPVPDAKNLYSETTADKVSPALANDKELVYVPHVQSNDVYVIDPATFKVVDKFKVGVNPQHVVPSWDLQTLWVTNNAEGTTKGSLTPIDPKTGKPGRGDQRGRSVQHVLLARRQVGDRGRRGVEAPRLPRSGDDEAAVLDRHAAAAPGVNHADFSIDGRYAIFTCEFSGGLAKVDLVNRKVVGYLKLSKGGMPQDIRVSPDGTMFYVADMQADGIFVVDGETFKEIGFIETGKGTHGLYPSRDGKKLYVANRGSHKIHGVKGGPGSVSVVDFATRKVEANWPVPGGGSPDMGNVSADGKTLWLSGRYDNVVYAFDTTTGEAKVIKVGSEPHGLAVWPQPGRYSLGHTGNMR